MMAEGRTFGPFRVDGAQGILWKHGIPVQLPEQSLAVLLLLLEAPGEVVTREAIRGRLWPDGTVVEFEHSINTAVGRLREVLGDSAANPRYVATVPRRGYRFVGEVARPAEAVDPPEEAANERRSVRMAAVPLFALLLVTALVLGMRARPVAPGSPIRSLCVLPLENLSGAGEQYFAAGFTHELTAAIARSFPLQVIAHESALRYAGANKTANRIGRDLKVDSVLQGGVERRGGRLRVTLRLTEAATETVLWSRAYDREAVEVMALQDEMAEDVGGQVRLSKQGAGERRMARPRPIRPAAYDAYLKGRLLAVKYEGEAQRRAAGHFEQALELEPEFAPAQAQLAHARSMLAYWRDEPAGREVLEPMKRAMELDSTLAEAHVNYGDILFFQNWDWEGGVAAFRRAVALDPGSVEARGHLAGCLEIVGRRAEALIEAEIVHRLAPFSLVDTMYLGGVLHRAGQTERAVALLSEGIQAEPTYAQLYTTLGAVYEGSRQPALAFESYMKAESLQPSISAPVLAEWTQAYESGGLAGFHRKVTERRLASIKARSVQVRVSPVLIATQYLRMGDQARALDELERAYRERCPSLAWLGVRRQWDPLRGHPRFQALLRRMNHPAAR